MSREEVRAATVKILKGMKKNKTCAEDGLVAEMLQTKHEGLIQAIAATFTDLLSGKAPVPHAWRKSKLIILFKKGDAKYRPTTDLLLVFRCYANYTAKYCWRECLTD